jgi:hypothetical protein
MFLNQFQCIGTIYSKVHNLHLLRGGLQATDAVCILCILWVSGCDFILPLIFSNLGSFWKGNSPQQVITGHVVILHPRWVPISICVSAP